MTFVVIELVALVVVVGWFVTRDTDSKPSEESSSRTTVDKDTTTIPPSSPLDTKAPTSAQKPVDPSTPPPPTSDSALTISQVERLQRSFDPTAGETTTIRFSLSSPADVSLDMLGPNREQITTLLKAKRFPAGLSSVVWDGRDLDGTIVPDEAYSFRIAAVADAATAIWDPLSLSGGERMTAANLRPIGDDGLSFQLPQVGRVLVRAAVVDGPLLRTIVNWEPRTAGLCTERWNGMDADGLRKLVDVDGIRMGVMAFALPTKSIITKGNKTLDYATYYRATAKERPHSAATPRVKPANTIISPHWRIAPHENRDPTLSMELIGLPSSGATTPAITEVPKLARSKSPLLVRIDVPDPYERAFMNNQKFELIIFVNDKRILEIERGSVPFTYPWDVTSVAPGQHVLTVNLATFRNHVGTASRIVEIVE